MFLTKEQFRKWLESKGAKVEKVRQTPRKPNGHEPLFFAILKRPWQGGRFAAYDPEQKMSKDGCHLTVMILAQNRNQPGVYTTVRTMDVTPETRPIEIRCLYALWRAVSIIGEDEKLSWSEVKKKAAKSLFRLGEDHEAAKWFEKLPSRSKEKFLKEHF